MLVKGRSELRLETILLLLIMVLFVISAIPRLSLPFFWDASWVYAPAVYEMQTGIPGLIPGVISTDLSRGHPLMFFFLAGSWAKVFGFDPVSLHLFGLLISLGVLYMIYLLGSKLVNPQVGVIAVVICTTQEIFLAQSLLLLPEMLLTLCILATFYCYLTDRRWLYVIAGTALLLTKETGVVCIASVGILYLVQHFVIRRESLWARRLWIDALWIISPALIASLHYVIQKFRFGWFFFPEHMDYQNKDLGVFLDKIREISALILEDQFRLWLTMVAILLTAFWLGRQKWWRGVLLVPGLWAFYRFFQDGWGLGHLAALLVSLTGVTAFFIVVVIPFWKRQEMAGRGLFLLLIYTFLFVMFSGYNFLTGRYILNVIPLFAILAAYAFSRFVFSRWMYVPLLGFPLVLLVFQLRTEGVPGDGRLTYADGVKVFQFVTEYFSAEDVRPARVMGTLLDLRALTDPRACYVTEPVTGLEFTIRRDPQMLLNGEVDYLVNTNFIDPINMDTLAERCCILLESVRIGSGKVDIYRVKGK